MFRLTLRLITAAFMLVSVRVSAVETPLGRVKVTLWDEVTGFERDAVQAVVTDFNNSQSKIFVDLVTVPAINQKILVATAGGVPPDIAAQSETNIAPLVDKEALISLDAYVKKAGISAKNYLPVYWDICQLGGHTWGLPEVPYLTALHWNKDAFRKAGLDPERPPQTFAELERYSERLTRRNAKGEIEQMGFLPSEPGWLTYAWVFYFGGGFFNGQGMTVDSPANIQAFSWVQGYAKRYGAGSLQSFRSSFGNYASAQNPFMAGKVAMAMDGVWLGNFIRQYAPDMKWGAAPFPVLKPGEAPVSMVGCNVLVIPKGAKHPDQAFEFIAYLNTQAAMEKICLGQMKNSPLSHVSEQFLSSHKNPYIRMFQKLASSKNATHPPVIAIWNEIWTEMMSVFDRAWLMQATPEQALAEGQARLQHSWAQQQERLSHQPSEFLRYAPMLITILVILGIGAAVLGFEWKQRAFMAKHGGSRVRGKLAKGLIFASPGLLGLAIFVLYPLACSLVYSFCDYSVLTEPRFIGLANFKALMQDSVFWKSLQNSLLYAAASLPLSLITAFIAAVLLDTRVKGVNLYRTLFFVPFVTPLVASAMVWLWIFNTQYGVLNYIIAVLSFGHLGPFPWLSDAHYAMPSLVLMSLWGVGQTMVIILAALQEVPVSIYEAAEMDGASSRQKLLHISVPFVSPVLYFNVIMGLIGSLQVFAVPYIMTGGGPARATEFYSMYLWENAFSYLKMGYACAMAWILFLTILGLTWGINQYSKKRVHYMGA